MGKYEAAVLTEAQLPFDLANVYVNIRTMFLQRERITAEFKNLGFVDRKQTATKPA
jgi:hypothetical protein